MITQEVLKKLFLLDSENGNLVWLKNQGKALTGNIAGKIRRDGYIYIGVHGKRYMAHRLIWLYVHGEMPTHEIDHVNGVRVDNTLSNLREATPSQNQHNKCTYLNNTSGFKGVVKIKTSGKWNAQIQVKGRPRIHIGSFNTPKEASVAYKKAAAELHKDFVRS